MATYSTNPSADTILYSNLANNNFGVFATFELNHLHRILMRFDLSSISSANTITSATLKFYKWSAVKAANSRIVRAYSVTQNNGDWTEGTKSNATAGAGEPCYNAKEADGSGGITTNWAGGAGCDVSGTDYEATELGTVTADYSDAVGTEYTLTFNNDGIARIQNWLDATNTNYGLLLLVDNTATGGNLFQIDSKESATASERPLLTIIYTEPNACDGKDFTLAAVTFDAPTVNAVTTVDLTAKDFDLAAATFDAPTLNFVTSGLVAEYRFDDGSGTTVSEYINNYDATITSGTWVTEGLENGAISAAGVPDSVFLGADGFTMMVVANVDTNSPTPVFASKGGNDVTETPIRWRGYTNSPILFTIRANTANRKSGTDTSRKTAVMNKGWQVYSIVAPQAIESDIVQYVNTCKYLTPQFGTGTGAATGTESALSSSITGKFAYILIYNRQLTHEEIETNYAYLKATLATRSITLPAMGVGLAFNGDSLTSGTGASFDNDYPSQTVRLLGAGYDKWNWGIPGSSFPFYDAGVDASISGSRTDYYYIIWGGSNSIDGGATAVNTYNSLLADIAARKAAGYDKVYVLTAINRAQYSDDQRTQFLAYNELIKDAGNQATYDYTAVDIASDERLWDYTNTTYFSTDQVHLTDVGYGVVATFVYAAIMGYDMLATTGMSLLPFTFDAPTFDTYEYREILDKIVRMNLEVNASVVLNKEIDFTYSELEAT